MWEAGRMGLVFVGEYCPPIHSRAIAKMSGPDAGDTIRSVLQTGTEVYAAVGNKLIKYFRGKEIGRLESPDEGVLGTMIMLGDDLLALKEDGTGMLIWNTKSGGTSFVSLSSSTF